MSRDSQRRFIRDFALWVVLATSAVATWSSAAAEPAGTVAGFARIDITPDYPVRLNGYGGRSEEATVVAARLHARAMAIGADGKEAGPALIVTVDNCAVIASVVEHVYRLVSNEVPIARERFVVASTHTHAAPVVSGSIATIFGGPIPPEQQARIERYTNELTDKLARVCLDALAARTPARLAWARGSVSFGNNRRRMKDGKWVGFWGGPERNPKGPTDHRLPVLAALGEDGKLLGLLTSYACHCTTTGGNDNNIHGDWGGFAADAIEAAHPGTVSLVAVGCGADQNPWPRGELGLAKGHGRELAVEIERLLGPGNLKPVSSSITARLTHISLPFEKVPDRAYYQELAGGKNHRIAYYARVQLERLDRGERLSDAVNYPIGVWAFGDDLAMVFLGGEVVVDYSVRLYGECDESRLWVNAYSNDVPCYIPSRRILNEGGYEADGSMMWYDKPYRFSPVVEDKIVRTVQQLLPATFRPGAE